MTDNKNREELMREAQRAFLEGYAEDMDKWSALREEQEGWRGDLRAADGQRGYMPSHGP